MVETCEMVIIWQEGKQNLGEKGKNRNIGAISINKNTEVVKSLRKTIAEQKEGAWEEGGRV